MDIKVDATLIPLRGRRMFLLLMQDVTAKQRTQQRLWAQGASTRALAESSTVAEASPKIFRAICENLGCDWGELWRVDPVANILRCTQVWHPQNKSLREMERVARGASFVRGDGIPGTVWARNRPVWITDVARHPKLQRAAAVQKYGLRSVVAFPIGLNGEVLGVITIFSRQPLPPDKHLLRLFKDICSQIGQVMGRRRAERRLLEVSESEQQRIGQDLHDGLCQQLVGLSYLASKLESKLSKNSRPAEAAGARRIAELARSTAVQARQVARGLNPVRLGKLGLMASLAELATSISSMFAISCQFQCRRHVLVPDHEAAVHLYRIAQEAVHNAITHGRAKRIVVSLARRRGILQLAIRDNGRGFDPGGRNGCGTGLDNMSYRARSIGAQLHIARRPGGGAVVTCTLPFPGEK